VRPKKSGFYEQIGNLHAYFAEAVAFLEPSQFNNLLRRAEFVHCCPG
jgi:hypothetical protein